jgi:hypothetical protein
MWSGRGGRRGEERKGRWREGDAEGGGGGGGGDVEKMDIELDAGVGYLASFEVVGERKVTGTANYSDYSIFYRVCEARAFGPIRQVT